MSRVSADSEAIRNFAKQVKHYIVQQEALIGKLEKQYRATGGQWRDLQYEKFGESLSDLESSIKRTAPAFYEYARKLEVKAQQIDEYDS